MDTGFPLESPSLSRRRVLNFITGATIVTTLGSVAYPLGNFFIPPAEEGAEGGAIVAKDVHGKPIPIAQILAEPPETRALVAGLAGEPTYLVVLDNQELDPIGIVDNCTHLGCTFPWNPNDAQFQCPCHGSLYDRDGRVLRGPAPLPLKIVKVAVKEGYIMISPWQGIDPRTGGIAWWLAYSNFVSSLPQP